MTKNELIHKILDHTQLMRLSAKDIYEMKLHRFTKDFLEKLYDFVEEVHMCLLEVSSCKEIPIFKYERRY